MKKILSVIFVLITLAAVFAFSASAAGELTLMTATKHVYGTAVLKWFAKDVEENSYFTIYVDGEKISSEQGYNGRHYYCYVDEIYPGVSHNYKVEYYERSFLGGYTLVDTLEKNVEIEDYFNGYGYKLSGKSESSDSVTLEWDYRTGYLDEILDPETDDRLLNVDEYFFEIYSLQNGIWTKILETQKEKITVENLKEGAEYEFRVKAFCKAKESDDKLFLDESEAVKVRTITEYTENFRIEEISRTSALLKWDFDIDELFLNSIYTGDYSFDVYMAEDYDTASLIGTTTETEFELTDLEEFTDYTVYVVLNCERTNGAYEKVEESKHIDFETTVTYFDGTAVNTVKSASAEISWKFDEKRHSEEYSDVDGYYYYVYYLDSKGKAVRIGTTQKQSYSLKNLDADTLYSIRIVAYYKDGETGKKFRIESIDLDDFKTRIAAPEKITISYTANKKLATLKWSAVEGASGYILYEYNFETKEYERLAKQKGRSYSFNYTYGEKYRFYVKAYKTTDGKDSAGDGTKNTFIPSKKVAVSSDVNCVKPGKKLTLKAVLSPSDSTDTIKWTTSNSDIAAVSSKGVVTGIENGKAVITATASSGKKTSFTVIVTDASISKTSRTVNVGQKYTLKINDYSEKVTWSTSNKKVATVTSKGVVTGASKGNATITAKLKNGAVFTCKIKVTKS